MSSASGRSKSGGRGRVPLERALSKLGLASRTVARGLILAGQVRVNGVLRRDPAFAVTPETAKIEIDGVVQGKEAWKCLLFHKPKSCTVTRSDEKGRKTVFDIVGTAAEKLHAVGRLDFATTGLLLLTNDTKLSSYLTEPTSGIPRTYVVTVRGEITDEKLVAIRRGVRDEGEFLKPTRVELQKASGRESHLEVELMEGKNREIRRIFASVGNEVTRLKRIAYGPLVLDDLAIGAYRELTKAEVQAAFPRAPLRASSGDGA